MKKRAIGLLLTLLLRSLNPDMVKELVDDLLDKVEDRFADNLGIMSLVNVVRLAFEIPDDIGGDPD